jgi:hypothetical protein
MTIEMARKLLVELSNNLSDKDILMFEQFCRTISKSVIRHNRKKRNEEKNEKSENPAG